MKVDEIIKRFKSISPTETVVEKKGAWVYVNGQAYRAKHLQEIYEGYSKPVEEEEPEPEYIELEQVVEEEPEPKEDFRKLLSAIRQDGKHIFRSTDLKKMQKAGKRIAKMAKRMLNVMGE